MTPFRTLLLAGIAAPLAAIALTASEAAPPQQGNGPSGFGICRPGQAQSPSPEDRVKCAEQAVDRAQRQLDRVTSQGGDTAEAEQRLADAQAELTAAQEALAAAADNTPPQDDGTATGEPPPQDDGTATGEPPPNDDATVGEPPPNGGTTAGEPPPEQQQQQQSASAPPDAPPAGGGSTVELQLQKQGNTGEINQIRKLRNKLRQEQTDSPPQSTGNGPAPKGNSTVLGPVLRDSGDRAIIQLGGGQIIIRQTEEEETNRLLFGARDASVDNLPNGFSRSVITRNDGTKIITTRDANGQVVKRVRVDQRGKELVMIDDSGYQKGPGSRKNGPNPKAYQFDKTLPPLRVGIPRNQYVVETRRASRRQIEQALMAPPVEEVERVYSLDEVRYSQRLRNKLRRIDVDTITFDFGSAAISPSQFGALTQLGEALADFIGRNPWATILVEGHTDAVGSDYANLLLSDRRAEAVAVALTGYFDIPPENLVTQGYGEQFLKIDTQLAERQNRRVSLVNITGLVQNDYDDYE